MTFNPNLHKRRSIRLAGYDYSKAGLYFVTLCTKNKECLFGKIEEGVMILNQAGQIVKEEWDKSANIRLEIVLHEYVVMPNHIHGIIEIVETNCRGDWQVALDNAPDPSKFNRSDGNQGDLPVAPTGPKPKSLAAMIGGYKSVVTKKINEIQNTAGSIWQRNYYEHIIRNAASYEKIADYIVHNPVRWQDDLFYQL